MRLPIGRPAVLRALASLLALAAVLPLRATDTAPAQPPSLPAPAPGALETNPAGWKDIMPSPDLEGWIDVPIPFTGKLTRAQWHIVNGQLVCDGDGGHDMLLLDRPLRNCIFHVEFCLTKIEGKKGYNSGVFIRTTRDGTFWNQAQVGSLSGGYWFGADPAATGAPKKYKIPSTCHVKEAGEWNTFELTAQGRAITLWVNGFPSGTVPDCGLDAGCVALEGEHFLITFRNLKLKKLP
jgi:hypothetical protein